MDQRDIQSIVEEVIGRLGNAPAHTNGSPGASRAPAVVGLSQSSAPAAAPQVSHAQPAQHSPALGVFDRMTDAIAAGEKASFEYRSFTVGQRNRVIAAIRRAAHAFKERWADMTVQETGMGRREHKLIKFNSVTDGTRGTEDLTTWAQSGDHGLVVEEMAPYGLIGAVTPSTHPVPTLINNSISMLAAGNTAVFNPHPASKGVFAEAVATFNREMMAVGAPPNLLTTVHTPTLESAEEMFRDPRTRVLLVTGGPGVVKAALAMPKKAITAGPGNPPVVVDETADLARAAKSIIDGGGFDNNVLCIGEKEVFCVSSVFDRLMMEMRNLGALELSQHQSAQLAEKAFSRKGDSIMTNRDYVGRNANVLADAIGIRGVSNDVPILFGEVDGPQNIWVQEEQLMPFMPFVRVPDVDTAIQLAIEAEHGYRHTACMHSTNLTSLSKMARICDCSIFVKNGPSVAGLAVGGEGYISYSIASPTGEGITTARTFTRKRRCTLVDAFRII